MRLNSKVKENFTSIHRFHKTGMITRVNHLSFTISLITETIRRA